MPTKKKRSTAGKPKATRKRRRATGATRKITRATKQVKVKKTAMKVLAGAAAGAMRAIMPPLEKAVGGQRASGERTR